MVAFYSVRSVFATCRVLRKISNIQGCFNSVHIANSPKMADKPTGLLDPPGHVNGMTVLCEDSFIKTISVPYVIVEDQKFHDIIKHLKKYMLKVVNVKPVQGSSDSNKRKVLLDPIKVKTPSDIDNKAWEILSEKSFMFQDLVLGYKNWNADVILKAVLPKDNEPLTSYSVIGHIIHLNIKDHLLPFKNIIGQVLLDKVKNAKTVVNKTNKIDNTYRNFEMELICGEDNMLAEVKENHFRYEFDFSKVYWNPRLSTEHEKVVAMLKNGDIVIDVFAGVGPFSIPAAKKGYKVFANDLNPDSYKWMNHNIKLNKIKPNIIKTFNKDGIDFITSDIKSILMNAWHQQDMDGRIFIIMNLPACAIDFIKHFKHIISKNDLEKYDLKIVQNKIVQCVVYFFTRDTDNAASYIAEQIAQTTGSQYHAEDVDITFVRNVSNGKDMMRAVFTLPPMLYMEMCGDVECLEPAAKRKC